MTTKILVVFAHPYSHYSRVNVRLLDAISQRDNVLVQSLYDLYPDFLIDVEHEQKMLVEHDVIILQHPFYWYSCPSLLKEWIDTVLQKGFAFGDGAAALKGKRWFHCVSTGGSEEAYQSSGSKNHSMKEFMLPFEQTALLCGMKYLDPFVVHSSYSMSDPELFEHCQAYQKYLDQIIDAGGN